MYLNDWAFWLYVAASGAFTWLACIVGFAYYGSRHRILLLWAGMLIGLSIAAAIESMAPSRTLVVYLALMVMSYFMTSALSAFYNGRSSQVRKALLWPFLWSRFVFKPGPKASNGKSIEHAPHG